MRLGGRYHAENSPRTQNPESDRNHYNVYRGTTVGFPVTCRELPHLSRHRLPTPTKIQVCLLLLHTITKSLQWIIIQWALFVTRRNYCQTAPPGLGVGLGVTTQTVRHSISPGPNLIFISLQGHDCWISRNSCVTTTPIATPTANWYQNTVLPLSPLLQSLCSG